MGGALCPDESLAAAAGAESASLTADARGACARLPLATRRHFPLLAGMDLAAARQQIQKDFARMDALYLGVVFDEWAILSATSKIGVIAYSGPRVETFRVQLPADVEPLRSAVAGRPHGVGDFDFTTDADGTRYDACLKLGESTFLVCNHTARTMAEIRHDPKWLKAQAVFFELSEKFRADPLVA